MDLANIFFLTFEIQRSPRGIIASPSNSPMSSKSIKYLAYSHGGSLNTKESHTTVSIERKRIHSSYKVFFQKPLEAMEQQHKHDFLTYA